MSTMAKSSMTRSLKRPSGQREAAKPFTTIHKMSTRASWTSAAANLSMQYCGVLIVNRLRRVLDTNISSSKKWPVKAVKGFKKERGREHEGTYLLSVTTKIIGRVMIYLLRVKMMLRIRQ